MAPTCLMAYCVSSEHKPFFDSIVRFCVRFYLPTTHSLSLSMRMNILHDILTFRHSQIISRWGSFWMEYQHKNHIYWEKFINFIFLFFSVFRFNRPIKRSRIMSYPFVSIILRNFFSEILLEFRKKKLKMEKRKTEKKLYKENRKTAKTNICSIKRKEFVDFRAASLYH